MERSGGVRIVISRHVHNLCLASTIPRSSTSITRDIEGSVDFLRQPWVCNNKDLATRWPFEALHERADWQAKSKRVWC